MADNGGMVKSLRETATTERLRSDHILTLELMQETVDDNVALKAANKRLLARLARLDDNRLGEGEGEDENEEGAGEGEEQAEAARKATLQKVLKQAEELTAMRTENKLLKGRAVQDEKRIRDLQRSSSSNEAMKRELDAFKAKLTADDASSAVGPSEGECRCAEMQALLDDLSVQLGAATEQLHNHVPGCADRIRQLEQQVQDSRDAGEVSAKKLTATQEQAQALEQQLELLLAEEEAKDAAHAVLQAKYKDLRKVNDDSLRALHDRRHREAQAAQAALSAADAHLTETQAEVAVLQSANASLQQQVAELLSRLQRIPANPLLLQAESSESSFFLTGDAVPAPAPAPAGAATVPQVAVKETVSFDEFVRLRTENKALKLQLVELITSGQKGGNKGTATMRGSASAAGSIFG